MASDKNEELSISDKIALFIQKYRTALLVLLILCVTGILGAVAFFSIRATMQKNAIVTLETLEKRMFDLGDLSDTTKSMDILALLEELKAFAPGTFGYASAKAYSLAADIHAARNEWNTAEEFWVLSSQRAPKIYLAPLSLYNAAVAAEEQGKLDAAIEYYNQSLLVAGEFPAAPRARFNIARIYEAKNDKAAAAEAYRSLIEKVPSDSNWIKLAQSRLISLELE
jgi:tetratricopeptide (TPR) repeat protein